MNFSELKTAVADYLHRTDLTTKIPTFIGIAESYIFRELRIKELETSVSGTTTGEYFTLPSDFGSISKLSVTYSGTEHALDYLAMGDSPTATTYPSNFSFEKNQVRIWGAGTGQAYTLYYVPDIAPLSDSNTSNWVLANAQELYLYASALEGARYLKNDAEIQRLTPVVTASLESARNYSQGRGYPLTASLQIKRRG